MRYVPNKMQVHDRLTSVKAWELPKQKSALAPDHIWTNEDMDPVKLENQTWTLWTWMAYWATDTINLGTWETASSILSVGLTWRDAIPIVSCDKSTRYAETKLIRTDCGWHNLCSYSDGFEWSDWRKTTYPFLGRHSGFVRILLGLLLHCVSLLSVLITGDSY